MNQETNPGTQAQLDWLQKQKPFFATPCYGGMIYESYLRSIIRMIHMLISSLAPPGQVKKKSDNNSVMA